MMDFKKLKSINWVGNIYQKFETICQEVDGIVNQDTIKYVENQVQTVGKSVKKISNAVQDLLPPVKHDARGVAVRQKYAISAKSRENVKENSLDVTAKQSPTEPNVKDPVRNQLSLVSMENDLAYQPNPPTMNTLEVSELELSVGKIDDVLANEKSLIAIEKQSSTEPNVMNPVTNQPSLVSSKYRLADQPSSPTLIDTVEVPESDLSVGKVDEVLTSEGFVDATENQSPTKVNAMDPVTNQLSVVSSKYHLPDQPSSPTSVDTLKVSESDLSVGNIENSLDSTEKQLPMEPNVMDHVTKQLSLVGSKYYLADQSSSPTSVDTLKVLESELSVENTDEVWTNENSLDATENQTPTYPNVIDPYQPSHVFSKYNLAGQLSSPASMNTLEVSESDLSVPEFDDIFTNEDSEANNEETAIKVYAPILEELTFPFVADHFIVAPHGEFCHSNHENRHSDLPKVAPATSVDGLEFESEQKVTVCDNSSDETECVSGASSTTSAFSVVSGENAIENMELASLSSSSAKESLRLSGYSPENLSLEAVEVAGCVSNDSNGVPSSDSPLTVSGENKDVDTGLSSSSSALSVSLESVAEGTSRIAEIMPLTVPSRNQQVQICNSVQYDAFKSSLDIGCPDESSCDFSLSPMETIDLDDKVKADESCDGFHDKVKLEESCVIVDDSVLHAISSRARKLRSYKTRIQDAFTSKKRLTKEYEQLAIWFGDSDIESSQETLSNMKNSETDDACDSEWELL